MFSECEPDYGNPAHCHCRCGLHTHGGLTPAALGCVFDSRRTMLDSRGTAFGSPNHGGLTRDALLGYAFVHRKNRFSLANVRTATQERGGVSPPWNVLGMRTLGPDERWICTLSRKPPVVCSRNANPITEIPRIAIADAVCTPTAG
jgi:hypothetical protein